MSGLWVSSIGKKIVSAITGLGMVLFVIIHLAGNLTLFAGAEAFNGYTYFLEHLLHGAFVYIAEAGLLLFFLTHIVAGISVSIRKGRARDVGYEVTGNAGGPSQKNTASLSMILSGIALLVFVVIHLFHFKFGPGEAQGYTTTINGIETRDLYRLVIQEFNEPLPTIAYVSFMLFLGLHLRHGIASAFQSLGVGSPHLTPVIRAAGILLAVVLVVGFVLLPIYIYFMVDPLPPPTGAEQRTSNVEHPRPISAVHVRAPHSMLDVRCSMFDVSENGAHRT